MQTGSAHNERLLNKERRVRLTVDLPADVSEAGAFDDASSPGGKL